MAEITTTASLYYYQRSIGTKHSRGFIQLSAEILYIVLCIDIELWESANGNNPILLQVAVPPGRPARFGEKYES